MQALDLSFLQKALDSLLFAIDCMACEKV